MNEWHSLVKKSDLVEFHFGDQVYLKCDDEGCRGLVAGLVFRPAGVLYCVAWGDRSETSHYGFELTREKPV